MSTTDTRAAFEAAVCEIVPRPLFLLNEDGSYQEIMVRGFWKLWNAAIAHASHTQKEVSGQGCALCGNWIGHDLECKNHPVNAATEAAKATGTAELPSLPEGKAWASPLRYGSKIGFPKPVKPANWDDDDGVDWFCHPYFTADQMREYGQQCAEAARQPTPEVELPEGWKIVPLKMTDEQAKETAYNINRKYKVAGPLSDFLVRQIWEWGIYASPNPPAEAARQPAPVVAVKCANVTAPYPDADIFAVINPTKDTP